MFLFSFTYVFSQSHLEGFIYDKETNISLPYATVKVISSNNYYTITNEDGKFEIYNQSPSDSLEIRFNGYKTKKVSVASFKQNFKIYLSPNVFYLDQVLVVANIDENYKYNLLNSLIHKYKNKEIVTNSKAFLTLTSSAGGIPIEIIEGFYNSKQNLSEGVVDLILKSGRFGQNASFPFYSLNNTGILKDFQLFKQSSQLLPLYPGNLSLRTIKNKYTIKIDQCTTCGPQEVLISFTPKKHNGRLFYGKIIFDKETLTIKKIELEINDPIIDGLSSIVKKDVITPKNIKLNINFNPLDYDKIQSLNFEFTMYYKSKENLEVINSNSLLYFYDYNNPFEEPYFTSDIHFNNDYDKIIALQAIDNFWELNYQFPKSYKEKKSIRFFEKYGYLINYNNTIPLDNIKYAKPYVISWNKDKKLGWESVKQELNNQNINYSNNTFRKTGVKAGENFHSISDIRKNSTANSNNQVFKFGYVLDQYKNKDGDHKFITRTLFDRNSSYCKLGRTKYKLIYLNIIFDIYEYYRQNLNTLINNNKSFNEVKTLCKEKFKEASLTVKKMKKETNNGSNYQNLIRWDNALNQKLTIN